MRKLAIVTLLLLFISASAWGAGTTHSEIKSPAVREALGLLDVPSPENFEKSRSLLNATLKKDPKNVEAHMGLVRLVITEYTFSPQDGTGRLQEALKHADSALKINPNLLDAYRKKSLVLFWIDRKSEGLTLLKTALKKWPRSEELHEAYLAYLLSLGNVKEAEHFSHLEKSRIKNKKEMFLRLGRIWQQAGYAEQADECVEHSLHNGETPQAWAELGRSFIRKKDYPMAIEFFQRALAIDSKYHAIYTDLAFCYHQVGQSREAVRWMERYISAFPRDLVALGNLAGLYEQVGEKVKARLAWTKVKANTEDPGQARLAADRLEKMK